MNFFNDLLGGIKGAWDNLTGKVSQGVQNLESSFQNFQQQLPQVKIQAPQIPQIDLGKQFQQYSQQAYNALPDIKGVTSAFINNQLNKPGTFGLPFTNRQIGNTLLDFTVRPVSRIGFEGAQSLAGDQREFNPQTSFEKFLLGDKPLQNFNNPNRPAREFLRGMGASEGTVNNVAPFMIAAGAISDVLPFGGAKKKVGEGVVEQGVKRVATNEAKAHLASLIGYADDLYRRGYSKKEIANIGYKEYLKIIDESEPGFAKFGNWLKSKFTPLFTQEESVQTAVKKFEASNMVSKVDANNINLTFKDLGRELGLDPQTEWKLVQWSQRRTPQAARELGLSKEQIQQGFPLLEKSRQFNDELFNKAKEAGIDMGYLENHIFQSFRESSGDIENLIQARGLNKLPGFTKKRTIPDYMAALEKEYELTPRYTTFGQANAQAYEIFQKALANQELSDFLLKGKKILPESEAPKSWKPIQAIFFPKNQVKVGDTTVQEAYYAPQELASFLNNMFGTEQTGASKVFQKTGDFSAALQDMKLSSPGLTVNSFTIGQLFKDLATGLGDLVTLKPIRAANTATAGIQSMIRGLIPGASEAFERAHFNSIREMAANGIGYQGILDYKKGKNVVAGLEVGKEAKGLWSKLINEPTFAKFMFQRKVQLYEGFKNQIARMGKSESEAAFLAAQQLKKYDGYVQSLGRSKDLENVLKTFVLAPKYREAVLGSGVNMVRGLLDFKNPEYSPSRSLLLGLVATYFIYNEFNKQLNGKNMWENPPGKEFELVVPNPKDPNKYYSVPWMPSSTAIYRRVGAGLFALGKGDINEAAGQFGSLGSIPVSIGTDLISGKDYFGRPLFDSQNPGIGEYANVLRQEVQPTPFTTSEKWLNNTLAGKPQNGWVTLGQIFELPIKEGTQPNPYFTAKNKIEKTFTPDQRITWDYLTMSQKDGGLDSKGKADILIRNPELLEKYKELQTASNPKDPIWSRSTDDIKHYLAYKLVDDTQQRAAIRVVNPWIPQAEQEYYKQIAESVNKPQPTIEPGSFQDWTRQRIAQINSDLVKTPQQPEPFKLNPPTPMSQLSEEQVKIASLYTAMPQGSPQRKAILAANPWLKDYWNQNSAYYQQYPVTNNTPLGKILADMGINNTQQAQSGFRPYTKKPRVKKVKVPKPKKIKAPKTPKVKIKKQKQFKPKLIKLKNFKA